MSTRWTRSRPRSSSAARRSAGRRHRPGSSSRPSTASTRRSWPRRRGVPDRDRHGHDLGRGDLLDRRLPGGLDHPGALRVGQRGHHGRDGHRPRHRRRRGVPLGRRPGDGRDRARAEGLRRAGRGVRARPPAHPRCDGPGAARGRDDGRGDIGGSRLRLHRAVLPVLRGTGLRRWRRGAALLRADRPFDGAGDRLADAGRDRDRHRAGSGVVHEIDGRPAIEFLARYLDVTGPASFGNPLAVVEAGRDESYLRAIAGTDPASGRSSWPARSRSAPSSS